MTKEQEKISQEVKEIKLEIQRLNSELKEVQKKCTHPATHLRYYRGANIGNWSFLYWTDVYCGVCNHTFELDGHPPQPEGAVKVHSYNELFPKEVL